MAVRSGLGSQLGFAAESVYGTYVAPNRFYEYASESLNKETEFVQGGGLAAGRFARSGSRRSLTRQFGSGSFTMDVPNQKFGLLLAHLMGSSTTPVQQGATIAYLQTHAFADNFGFFLTGQKGVPDTSTGTARPYSFLGGKIKSMEFSCGVGEQLKVVTDFDFQAVSESQGLATASYATGLGNWTYNQMAVKLGTFGSEAAVAGINGVTMKIERPMKDDRASAVAGLKGEPIINDYANVSGTFEAEFYDKTILADRFAAGTSTSLIWEFVGANIASTYYYTIQLKVPMIFLGGDTPQVDGPDVVGGSFPWEGKSDGTNPLCTVTYTSIDTAI
jgi:hypothetical protein